MKKIFIIYLLLVIAIVSTAATIINNKSKDISRLEKDNNELKEENELLKHQLKEVPSIIESNKEEICK